MTDTDARVAQLIVRELERDDQHVIPTTGDHVASPGCRCNPRVDDGVPQANGRVWIHNQEATA